MPLNPDTLKRLREQRGLTQTQLAERAGMTMQAICNLERGRRPDPRISTIERLAAALKVRPAALLVP